jgi:N-acetylglucosaminyldiphosphoundecaprenol N-acetyl-beta-D-mannosaminyltransferase
MTANPTVGESHGGRESSFKVLGVRVDAVQMPEVIARMEKWIQERSKVHYVAVSGMHGVAEAQYSPLFKQVLNASDLVVPDGISLVWMGRLRGYDLKRRVCGPDLMPAFCAQTLETGYRHFFYGGAPGVAQRLAQVFSVRFPGLQVVGTYCPPFRPLTDQEELEVLVTINRSRPDILWIGLGTPKQEHWMYEHREKLHVPVMVGVGAAFDFGIGRIRRAPTWMGEHGLEWLWRLATEPRRLWRRDVFYGSKFILCVILELLGLRRFD